MRLGEDKEMLSKGMHRIIERKDIQRGIIHNRSEGFIKKGEDKELKPHPTGKDEYEEHL